MADRQKETRDASSTAPSLLIGLYWYAIIVIGKIEVTACRERWEWAGCRYALDTIRSVAMRFLRHIFGMSHG